MAFSGAKLALFLGGGLLVIQRDDRPDIPFAGHWDFPGGGREGTESPTECVLRETFEEVGLQLRAADLIWSRQYGHSWFFAARRPVGDAQRVRFGDEGQGWRLMTPNAYIRHPMAIPSFADRLGDFLCEMGAD